MRARTPWWFLCVSVLAAACTDDAPATLERPVTSCRVAPFDNVTLAVGVDFVHHEDSSYCDVTDQLGPGVCMLDYDRDGDQDLYFMDRAPHPNRLYRNDGGRFADVTEASGIRVEPLLSSATAGDVDGDGAPDLVVGRYLDPSSIPMECNPAIEKATPLTSYLFMNRGGRFVEEGASRGLTERDPTLAVKLYDLDLDGDLDLYVGNDFGLRYPDRFYLNDGRGHFVDRAATMGLDRAADGDSGDTMGVDIGDVDLDGSPDLVASGSERNRVFLYRCDRSLRCVERSEAWGLGPSLRSFNWALGLEDFDLDGDLDLFVANGLIQVPRDERNQLFWNVGGRFVEHATAEDEALAAVQSSRGAVFGDLDGDGAVDAVVANVGARPEVLLNRAGCGHWLAVRLDPPVAGARVRVTAGGRTLERQLSLGGSYLGSNSATLHFGLGLSPSASLEVRWPGGRVLRRDPSPIDQVLTVR